jgi:CRISPR-associated endoribonuclease Cas6
LLTSARPTRWITLSFCSPTGFRSRNRTGLIPPPRLCFEGWLRKWNTFAEVVLPEAPLLEYVEGQVKVVRAELRQKKWDFGGIFESGVVGKVVWEVEGRPQAPSRLVSALADYAHYCGTGAKTAQGMGQTIRLQRGNGGFKQPGG